MDWSWRLRIDNGLMQPIYTNAQFDSTPLTTLKWPRS